MAEPIDPQVLAVAADLVKLVGVEAPLADEALLARKELCRLILGDVEEAQDPEVRGERAAQIRAAISEAVEARRPDAMREISAILDVHVTVVQARRALAKARPVCVAAAGELLGLTDETAFQQLFVLYEHSMPSWETITSNGANVRTTITLRQTRLAVWFINSSYRSGEPRRSASIAALRGLAKELIERVRPPRQAVQLVPPASTPVDQPADHAFQSALSQAQQKAKTDLAAAVARQLDEDEHWDRLSDPYPLPVRWENAAEEIVDHWENIRGEHPDGGRIELAATLPSIAETYAKIPSGRLVILGPGGAGKTVLVRHLARALLAPSRRGPGDPVPVIFAMNSWNPLSESLRSWMAGQLVDRYLGAKLRGKRRRQAQLLALQIIRQQHILPIFEGLDEVAPSLRQSAILALNDSLGSGDRFVLTSRAQEYEDAVNASRVLVRTPAVIIKDLILDDVANYLPRTTRKLNSESANRTKWDPVLKQAQIAPDGEPGAALRSCLTTPLMVSLARATYSDTERDPAELLNFADVDMLSEHLLDQFTVAAYDRFPLDPDGKILKPYRADEARRWLGYIATVLASRSMSDFEWSGRRQVADNGVLRLTAGVLLMFGFTAMFGILLKMPGLTFISLLAFMPIVGLLAGESSEPRRLRISAKDRGESEKSRERSHMLYFGIAMACLMILLGVSEPAVARTMPIPGDIFRPQFFAAVVAGVFFVVSMLISAQGQVAVCGPGSLLRADIRLAVVRAGVIATGLLPVFVAVWSGSYKRWLLTLPLILIVTFATAMLGTSSGFWLLASFWHALHGRLPFRTIRFLNDARGRGIVRFSGSAYQFRHGLLLDRLAKDFISNSRATGGIRRTILIARAALATSQFKAANIRDTEMEFRRIIDDCNTTGYRWDEANARYRLALVLRAVNRIDDAATEAGLALTVLDSRRNLRQDSLHLEVSTLHDRLLARQAAKADAPSELS